MKLDLTGSPVKLIIIALAGIGAVSVILKIIPHNSQTPATTQNPVTQNFQDNSLEKVAENDFKKTLEQVGITYKDIKVRITNQDDKSSIVFIEFTTSVFCGYIEGEDSPYKELTAEAKSLGYIGLSKEEIKQMEGMGLLSGEKWRRSYVIYRYNKSGSNWVNVGYADTEVSSRIQGRYLYPELTCFFMPPKEQKIL